MTLDHKLLGLLVVLASAQAGCAGAECNITANTAKYPMSFSLGLPNDTGRVLTVDDGLETVGSLYIEKIEVGFLYGQTKSHVDISDDVNRQVRIQKGEGVIALKLEASNCPLSYLFPLIYSPVWPGCVSILVTGQVVKVVAITPPAIAPPAVAPPVVETPVKAPEEIAPAPSDPSTQEGTNP